MLPAERLLLKDLPKHMPPFPELEAATAGSAAVLRHLAEMRASDPVRKS